MKATRDIPLVLLGALLLSATSLAARQATKGRPTEAPPAESRYEWPAYGGSVEGIRYSRLAQVNRANVGRLAVAWTYDTGEGPGGTQAQPLVAGGVLYTVTPRHNVVALDAATGKQLWKFESGDTGRGANRGVALWSGDGERRIFACVRHWLYALDGATGRPIPTFGAGGRIDLREGLGR